MYIPDLTERYPEGFRAGDDSETFIVCPTPETPEHPSRLFKSFNEARDYARLLTALDIDNYLETADEDDIFKVRMQEKVREAQIDFDKRRSE